MTPSSQPIHKHICDIDDNFERTLRQARNQQEPQPSQPTPDLREDKIEEQEEPTAQVVEEDPNMAADNRTIKELSASGLDNAAPLCIQYPMAALGKTNEFELKSSLLHHIPKFHGMSMEDPNKHLKEFEVVCSSMTHVNVDGSILKMNAFPFSLLEKAKEWLYELALGTITSWESMKRAFLEKFFSTSRVILLRKRISGIQQNQGESFPTYYEGFKTLVALCPQHQMKEELLLQYFYERLLPIERQMLDTSAGGALVDKTPMAAKTLIANRALNAQQYEGVGQRDTPRQQVNEGQENQAKAMQNQEKRVDQMEKQIGQIAEFVGQFREQELITEEEEQITPTERVETPLPQAPKAPKPSNSANKGKQVPILINYNVVPPNVPFPRRFMQSKKEEAENDILETFRKVQVNIPLLDAIKQVPRYAKFLKELCTTRKRISSKEVVKPKGVLEDVLVQVNHLIFPADFYVLEMDESDHSPTLPILLGRPFMKTAQTMIDVAKGSVTMAFGGDMISFNIPKSVENTNDVHFCCAIDVIENIGQKSSTQIKKKVPRTTIEEEIGVNNKECMTTPLKTPILTESNPCAFVDSAATSLQHIGTSPNPISIPISTKRLFPSMVQVPNRMQGSREG
ncbi:unnamed protein product [Malus baccata var. baccata]